MRLQWAIEVIKPLYKNNVINLKKSKDLLQSKVALVYITNALKNKEIKEKDLIELLSKRGKKC